MYETDRFMTFRITLSHLRAMATKPNVVFVLGAPGSGKGTQCQKIVDKFGFVHLSAGDLLRAEGDIVGSPYGKLIATYLREGKIIPVEITCHLIVEAMKKSGKNNFLIDGFPRNEDNLEGWNREMSGKVNEKCVLFIECSEKTCIDRCLDRGQQGSGRTDDNVDSLKKRFNVFHTQTMPIVEYFEKKKLVTRVNGDEDAEAVFESISKYFAKFMATDVM